MTLPAEGFAWSGGLRLPLGFFFWLFRPIFFYFPCPCRVAFRLFESIGGTANIPLNAFSNGIG